MVVVYSSVDEEFARTVLDRFGKRSGIAVRLIGDSEAGKTTGLVNRILSESAAGGARADVFWSSELFSTIRLAREGALEPYEPPSAADIPERFRDPQRRWTALAVRARVLAYDPTVTAAAELPTTWRDLARPEFASRTALANPLFGTTRAHVAAMMALWGGEETRAYLTQLRDGGVQIVDGNSAAVRMVSEHRATLAATDTDDVWLAQRESPLDLHYLDMGGGGTLLIPCAVSVVRGAPHAEAARQLVDYLVSAEAERQLAESGSRNIPVRESLRNQLGMRWPGETPIPFEKIADAMEDASAAVREILLR
ncbi:MAG: extracellular solute-binding protein [Planctomycetes bacterium]|nr:extracellular solute-binding protein [Planctomycetota bacterium]